MAVRVTAETLNQKCAIAGQGDNVLASVYIGNQGCNPKTIADRFISDLEKNISKLGLKLKSEETWYSSRLVEYGKIRYFNSIAVPNGTKRAMRIISHKHDGIPTIETSMTMISTATENIANQDWLPDPAFILYGIEILSFFNRKKVLTPETDLQRMLASLNFPNILGGLPLSNFSNHALRGIDDQLTVWISITKSIYVARPDVFSILCRLITLSPKPTVNLESFIKDIFS